MSGDFAFVKLFFFIPNTFTRKQMCIKMNRKMTKCKRQTEIKMMMMGRVS